MRLLFLLAVLCPIILQAQPSSQWEEIRSLYAEGKVYAGLKRANKELQKKDGDRSILILRADGRNRIGEYWQAAADAREALRIAPAELRSEAALQLGISLQGTDQMDSARYWLEEAAKGNDDAEALVRLARMDMAMGEARVALEKLDRILAKDPDHVKALLERGAARMDVGDTTGARADLDRAVELAPRDPVAWNSRGFHLYSRQNMHHEAIADYDRAIKFDPNYSFAFNNRGWSYFKLGDHEKARKNIRLAGRKRPNNPYVHRNLGMIALVEGDTTVACTHFRKAATLNFEVLHGQEVNELIRMNCDASDAPAERTVPVSKPPVRSNAPRSNAP